MKKFLIKFQSVFISVLVLLCTMNLPIMTNTVYATTRADLNSINCYLKQGYGTDTCTLYANIMMLRRNAIVHNDSTWTEITESSCRPVMWNNDIGMYESYDYYTSGGTYAHGFHYALDPNWDTGTGESFINVDGNKKREMIKNLLKKHPEGVVVYDHNRPHAILVTDYTDGMFYVADSDPSVPAGRIPESQSGVLVQNCESYYVVTNPGTLSEGPKYQISLNNTYNGTASLSKYSASEGETITVNATPSLGYQLDKIMVNGSAISGNTFIMPAKKTTVEVTFKVISYTLTIESIGNGTVSLSKTTAYANDTIYVTVKPVSGYQLDYIKVNGSTINGYSFSMPSKNTTVSVSFKKIPDPIASGNCGANGNNLTWRIDGNTLTISGSGKMADFDDETAPWRNYCDSIYSVVFSGNVTSIGNYAFIYHTNLTSFTIPSSITSIGDFAFGYCNSLSKITIPSSVNTLGEHVFCDCINLSSVSLPNGLTKISYGTFFGCQSLTNITIPNTVTCIGARAFAFSGLTSVSIPNGITSVPFDAFDSCYNLKTVSIPSSVTVIEDGAFGGCRSLTSFTISNNITSIGQYAFEGTGLTSLSIPSSVTSIGKYAFYSCHGLTSVSIPANIKKINEGTFGSCVNLKKVTIAQGIESIGDYAFGGCAISDIIIPDSVTSLSGFQGCKNLTSFTIPNSVTKLGDYAFAKCSNLSEISIPNSVKTFGDNVFAACTGIESITIPGSVSSVGRWAFENCTNLTNVNISDGVKAIDWGAFEGCTNLQSINIPNSVTTIDRYAFSKCSNISIVNIPESVTSITESAFSNCTELKSVVLPENLTNIERNAFTGCTGIKSVILSKNVNKDAFPQLASSVFHYYYNVEYTNDGNGTVSGKNKSFGTDYIELAIVPNVGYITDKVTLIYSDRSVTVSKDSDGNYICRMPDSDSSVTINVSFKYQPYIDSGTCGKNMSWKIDYLGNLIISGNGNMTDFSYSGSTDDVEAPWYKYKDSIKTVSIASSVKSVGAFAFYGCSKLTDINLDYVAEIGDYAFFNCKALKSITLSPNVTSIGSGTFENCTSLGSVTFTKSIVTIGSNAFNGCSSLADVYYDSTEGDWKKIDIGSNNNPLINAQIHVNPIVASGTYGENLSWTLDDKGTLTLSGSGAMANLNIIPWSSKRDLIQSVVFDGNITTIGNNAFAYCKNITSITIPSTVTSIGMAAFNSCSNLKTVIIPNSVTYMSSSVFYSCSSLTSITIPNSVTYIGNSSFANCIGLTSFTFPNSVDRIGSGTFSNCTNLKSIYIPNTILKIDSGVFLSCSSLTDIYYEGTESDWNSIDIYSNNSDSLSNVTIHYKECAHNLSKVDSKPATCENEGYETYYKCSICGKLYSDSAGKKEIANPVVIAKLGHNWDKGQVTKETSCEETGTKVYHCTREGCSEAKNETIPALGHDLKLVAEKAPSKTETGNIKYYKCERCSKLFSDAKAEHEITQAETVIPVLVHNLTKVAKKAETCTEAGNIEYYVCKDSDCGCGKYYSDSYGQHEISKDSTVISATGHSIVEVTAKNPTCEADGYESHFKCSKCGKLFSDKDGNTVIASPVAIPKTGHEWDEGEVTTAPGCETEGVKSFHCTHTGCNKTKNESIDPLGHDTEHVKHHEAVKETHLKDGNIEYFECPRCGKLFTDADCQNETSLKETIIPKKGAAELGEKAEAGDFMYQITNPYTDGRGTVTLIGVVNKTEAVVIPLTVEIKDAVYKVNRIGVKAFYGNKTIKTLNIGANVLIIDTNAFYGCSGLVKVSGGLGLKIIGTNAFARCTKLSTFVITSKVLYKIGPYAFSKDSRLKTVYIRNTVHLTKSGVKKSLKGSKVKKVKVKKSKVKKYKKYFTKKNCGRKVKVKK